MGTVANALIALIITGLLGIAAWMQHRDLSAEQQKNVALIQRIADKNSTIQQLQGAEANNKKRLAQLQTENQRINTTLAERETLIERLQHDDPQIQPWADTPLPDAIVRLRDRPASNGASDTYPKLPDHQPLLPASSQSEN